MEEFDLQPLRVISGWHVEWNTFHEVDPTEETIHYFDGSSLLHLNNYHRMRAINLEWRPERDVKGCFILRVLDLTEIINPKTKKIEYDGSWEKPHLEFRTNNRKEVVEKLEKLMLQLTPFNG